MIKSVLQMFRTPIIALIVGITIGTPSAWGSPTIQKQSNSHGQIDSVRIENRSVWGRIWRTQPFQMTPGAHVHVSLLDSRGKIIESGKDRLAVITPKEDSTHPYSSFRVTFHRPIAGVDIVRVSYISHSQECCLSKSS